MRPDDAESELEASWFYAGEKEEALKQENTGPGTKSVSGTKTTLDVTTTKAVEHPFNCVLVGVLEGGQPVDFVVFPLISKTALLPSNLTPSQTAPAPAPAPTFAPAVLAFGRSKPVTAKTGKWTKVKVKVANAGGTSVGPIAFKAKAPAGVIVKPRKPKLPALLGGQTWKITLQVKLTAKARRKSTIRFTGTAGALTTTGSVVVKAAG